MMDMLHYDAAHETSQDIDDFLERVARLVKDAHGVHIQKGLDLDDYSICAQYFKVLLKAETLPRADPQRIRAKNKDSRVLAHGFTAAVRSFLMENTFSPR